MFYLPLINLIIKHLLREYFKGYSKMPTVWNSKYLGESAIYPEHTSWKSITVCCNSVFWYFAYKVIADFLNYELCCHISRYVLQLPTAISLSGCEKNLDDKTVRIDRNLKRDDMSLIIGGDGRADSPGHSAKYGPYTIMDLTNIF